MLGHRDPEDQSITLNGHHSSGADFIIFESKEKARHTRFDFVAASNEDECTKLPFTIHPGPSTDWSPHAGKYPAPFSSSESIYAQARKWYHECASQHSDCARGVRKLPKRLLKLVLNPGGSCVRVSLCLTSERNTSSENIRYLALSYCWGEMTNVKTMTENIDHRMLYGFWISELPAVIQDAVTITQKMDFNYLWVDALCICQDKREEWEVEVAAMAEIYGGSAFTISALSSPDVHTHVLKPRSLSIFSIGSIEVAGGEPHVGETNLLKLFIRENPQHPSSELKTGPLSLRGWPLQERLLAPSVLHFGRDQVLWECNEYPLISETGMIEDDKVIRLRSCDYLALWQELIYDFNRRDMTVFSDRLPAVSGLATRFREIGALSGRYVAGLWEDHLIKLLMWDSQSSWNNMYDGRPAEKYDDISTWSWAHIDRRSYRLYSDEQLESDLILPPKFRFENADHEKQSSLSGSIVLSCQVQLHGFVQELNREIVQIQSQPNAHTKIGRGRYRGIAYMQLDFDEIIANPGTCYSIRMLDQFGTQPGFDSGTYRIEYLMLEAVNVHDPDKTHRSFLCKRIGRLTIAFESRCELFESYSDVILETKYPDILPHEPIPFLTDGRWREVILI